MTTPWTSSQAEQVSQPSSIYSLSQITRSLFIGNAVTANSRFVLSSYHITTVISVSVETVNTVFEGIQYLTVPVADSPSTYLYDFFDPIADHIHSVDMKQGRTLLHCVAGVSRSATLCIAFLMKYRGMSLLNAHKWTKLRRPIIRPNNGFWEQLIQYEYKLFTKNTVRMINSPVGRIPDIYQKKLLLMMPK
ncbi:dual specificity protein phosphatase 21 [Desmodus rotundus]|uniref:dual specificity protein phosphatase 21 n=1 Tax=Desmodus rotundus TaxID=9430 RepID=UPI000D18695B|nr:dual specificity protein phosphatase 21 [Desmodus rotundus]